MVIRFVQNDPLSIYSIGYFIFLKYNLSYSGNKWISIVWKLKNKLNVVIAVKAEKAL